MPTRILITGAGGEIGHGLIDRLADEPGVDVVALDLKGLSEELLPHCAAVHVGDILDTALLKEIFVSERIDGIIHLAAMLSSSGERNPERAYEVNLTGTMGLLSIAAERSRSTGRPVSFLFPSTIAVYGLPDLPTKERAGRVGEEEYLNPITMYGVNKLACEHLGRYFSEHYGALAEQPITSHIDFRGLRFPGLISAETVPTGGTSDYIPEMIHAAAQGRHYTCFAREGTRIPFMTMPDAVESILTLMNAPSQTLSRRVYNVGAFAPSAGEVAALLSKSFPGFTVSYDVDERRQRFLDTWPADVDDAAARADWGYAPRHTYEKAFSDYLLPAISGTHIDR